MRPRTGCGAGDGLAARGAAGGHRSQGHIRIITTIITINIIIIIIREQEEVSFGARLRLKRNGEGEKPQGPPGQADAAAENPASAALRCAGAAERGGTRRLRAWCSHQSDLLDAARAAK